jgi:hypothetical protein
MQRNGAQKKITAHLRENRGRLVPAGELQRAAGCGSLGSLKVAISRARADGLPVETITAYRLVRKK